MLSHNYAGCSLGIGDWRILRLLEQKSPADVRCDVFHSDIHNLVLCQLSPAILEFLNENPAYGINLCLNHLKLDDF